MTDLLARPDTQPVVAAASAAGAAHRVFEPDPAVLDLPLGALDADRAFSRRHLGPRPSQLQTMLDTLGFADTEELLAAVVPAAVLERASADGAPGVLPKPVDEAAAAARIAALAGANRVTTPMIGLGYHDTLTPPVIARNVLENPAWYTAYTPYQPEIAQGRLEALVTFQTVISDLAGLALANASLLDESTAAAEAMTLLARTNRKGARRFVVDADVLPQTKAVLATRAEPLGITLVEADLASITAADEVPGVLAADGGCFGVLLQYPGASGRLRDLAPAAAAAKQAGAGVAVSADLLALTVLTPPGEWGADVVVGSSQRFGVPLGYGGPHAGFMAVRAGLERSLPGRLVGVSVDADGAPAYRLALQTREQHIRRDKATSNICTAQVLPAVLAAMYAVWHGPDGLARIAARVHRLAEILAATLQGLGLPVQGGARFDTVAVDLADRADVVYDALRTVGITPRRVDGRVLAFSCDETTDLSLLERIRTAVGTALGAAGGAARPVDQKSVASSIPRELRRSSPYLTHPTFARYRSETSMLRYLRRLSDSDYALDRGMIPLGSCTMKLNATTEMAAISLPGLGRLHPFAPAEDAPGYAALTRDLETWLASLTGYAAVSLQPNAGSQGEFAGLLAIRAYHRSRGDDARTLCLIPASAHGTNAASAVMAGLRVQVVPCTDAGDVDLDALRKLCAEHSEDLAAIMVTYPSTHGVYEEGIGEIAALVHGAGGQVYVDGANLNALVGVAGPGRFGGDVSHLNLHKTFCIPHGGGGPGVGPIGVAAHLVPFLPSHPFAPDPDRRTGPVGPVSAAPLGSASILAISYAYVLMMGAAGMRAATAGAVLSANYIANRLRDAYPILYTGENGLVAHECILDLRPITKSTGITVDDVAKRLVDHGFHAPTMSFPVAGTLMVEPTESEDLTEIDRFCEAMLTIRAEIDRVAAGEWPAGDNPLSNAPHTLAMVSADSWTHPYPRELAILQSPSPMAPVYVSPVRRVDGAFGDRNLMCSCPPIEDLID
jgi:glycine dehydrogenase